eukprot:scaffold64682_cov36-Phaeocystis_antarctica.AAC.1
MERAARRSTSSPVSDGGVPAGAAAADSAAFRPSGDRATLSAASSAVAKLPRCKNLPPRLTCAW